MIARIWHGKTPKEKTDDYLEVIRKTGVPALRSTEGNRGVYILRRLHEDDAEFIVLSLWDSMESIRRFAGPETDKAVYYPEDDAFLKDRSLHVHHWEIFDEGKA
jgi:heme-degrading monooxygenase HmoA